MGDIFTFALEGGLNLEAGPSVPAVVREGNIIPVPWLVLVENVVYNFDGWPQKMPGASNVNSTATGAAHHVNGLFDYWRSGSGATAVQQRIVYSDTQIYSESAGVLTSIKTGLEASMMPWFEVMNDVLVIATSSSTDVPMTWNQTTFANLGGSPPNFDFHVEHKGRMWAAGVDANKSRLYYTVSGNQADWTGSGSGSIDVTPDDGDVITGLRSHNNELVGFKGPNKGAILRITGSSPTGSDAFALHPFVRGVGATNQQGIIARGGDLLFVDNFGLHSLQATDTFADYAPAFLSAPIASYFTSLLNHSRFAFVWGAYFAAKSLALWTFSRLGATTNNLIITLDFRFSPPRFAFWPAYSVASLAMVLDSANESVPWAGTYTGRAMRLNRPARNIAGAAYRATTRLPYVGLSDPFLDKTLIKGRVSVSPKGVTPFTVGWQRDGNTQQTASVNQGGVSTLGPSSDQFTLDSLTAGVLAGGRHVPQFFEMEGSCKEVQIELTQGTLDVDFEPHSMAIDVEGAGMGTVQTLG